MTTESAHVLEVTVRPAACSCGKAKYAGSPTFIRERHAVHVEDASLRTPAALGWDVHDFDPGYSRMSDQCQANRGACLLPRDHATHLPGEATDV